MPWGSHRHHTPMLRVHKSMRPEGFCRAVFELMGRLLGVSPLGDYDSPMQLLIYMTAIKPIARMLVRLPKWAPLLDSGRGIQVGDYNASQALVRPCSVLSACQEMRCQTRYLAPGCPGSPPGQGRKHDPVACERRPPRSWGPPLRWA